MNETRLLMTSEEERRAAGLGRRGYADEACRCFEVKGAWAAVEPQFDTRPCPAPVSPIRHRVAPD